MKHIFGFGVTLVLRVYICLWAKCKGSLLAVLVKPHGMPGIKTGSDTCKTTIIAAVLSL